jgi:CheY-like chemotaxis protein
MNGRNFFSSYTRFYPGVAAGRCAVLSVSDTGEGMDAATLERIFERRRSASSWRAERPDVAVLDVVMPTLGGLTTAGRLLSRFPGLPLILSGGYSHDHDARTADLPMASYLQKPYSPTHLGRRVRDVLDGNKTQN